MHEPGRVPDETAAMKALRTGQLGAGRDHAPSRNRCGDGDSTAVLCRILALMGSLKPSSLAKETLMPGDVTACQELHN